MKRIHIFALLTITVLVFSALMPMFVFAKQDEPKLSVIELKEYARKPSPPPAYPEDDDADSNGAYALLGVSWSTTASYWVNTKNAYGFSSEQVLSKFGTATTTWDDETAFQVFSPQGTTSLSAGKYDHTNVVDFGRYRGGVIAVTYIWSIGGEIVETDLRFNTFYSWSLNGESGKMDLLNIATHEFGHWAGLADLYADKDYWLTMYGYASYGQTCKQDLGAGDIAGIQAVYHK